MSTSDTSFKLVQTATPSLAPMFEHLEVVVEAEPAQLAQWQQRLRKLVTVTSIHVTRASARPGKRLLIEVTPGMSIPTRAEIQRLATENNVLLCHCGPQTQKHTSSVRRRRTHTCV
jgi:hypothetical protein